MASCNLFQWYCCFKLFRERTQRKNEVVKTNFAINSIYDTLAILKKQIQMSHWKNGCYANTNRNLNEEMNLCIENAILNSCRDTSLGESATTVFIPLSEMSSLFNIGKYMNKSMNVFYIYSITVMIFIISQFIFLLCINWQEVSVYLFHLEWIISYK